MYNFDDLTIFIIRGPLGDALARQKHSPHRLQPAAAVEDGEEDQVVERKVDLEWEHGGQVVEEEEMGDDGEGDGEVVLKQEVDRHLPMGEESSCEEEGGVGVVAVEEAEDAREKRGGEVESFEDAHIAKEEEEKNIAKEEGGMVCVEEARNWMSY